MRKIISLMMILFIAVTVYAVIPQQQNIQNNQKQLKQDFDKTIQTLNITDEQKQQIKQLMESDIAKRKELKTQMKEKMEAIDNELSKEKYDVSVIENLTKEIEQINLEILKIKVDGKIKMRNILTFKQYLKMEQHRKQVMKKFKHNKMK